MLEPLTNASHDISGLDGFILNAERLMASELWALSTGDEFKAAVALWCRAWKQIPAGSLPNDEKVLAAFSGAGKNWRKVRDVALRGFILCSDGRLYHPFLCEDVIRASEARVKRNERTKAATEARNRQRNDQRNVQRDDTRHDTVTKSQSSPVQSREVLDEKTVTRARDAIPDLEGKLREAAGWQSEPAPGLFVTGPIDALITAGCDLDLDILPTIRAKAHKSRHRSSWDFFTDDIRIATAKRLKNLTPISLNEAPDAPSRNKSNREQIFADIDARLDAAERREAQDGALDGGKTVVELPRQRA